MQSKKFKFNQEDAIKIGRVFLWLLASTTVAFLITLLPQLEMGSMAWLIPMVNIGLVALQKFIKENE